MKATIKRRLQLYAGERPTLFSALYWLKREHRAVQPTTQIVIEGFPRSANTFSVWAFVQAQHEDVRVAHHLHSPAQLIRAAQWRIPTLVLLRKPKDAVMSLVLRSPQPVAHALRQYISFYETATKYRDAYVLGKFEEVTENYGAVIERINDRFGTRFSLFHHTEENTEKVFSHIEKIHRARRGGLISEVAIARPSSAKKEMRRRIEPEFEAPKQKRLLAEATALYDYLATH